MLHNKGVFDVYTSIAVARLILRIGVAAIPIELSGSHSTTRYKKVIKTKRMNL